jgi:hypothetical protein
MLKVVEGFGGGGGSAGGQDKSGGNFEELPQRKFAKMHPLFLECFKFNIYAACRVTTVWRDMFLLHRTFCC